MLQLSFITLQCVFGLVASLLVLTSDVASGVDDRPRLFVLTDIGGDPDDQQSLVRLMVYANEFQIEGLVASAAGTPGELKQAITRPDNSLYALYHRSIT